MNVLADYRLLWRAAFVQRQHPALVPLTKILAALLFVVGVGAGLAEHDWEIAKRVAIGIPMVLLLLMWTMVALPDLALMNTPANARLVPRMRRRMVELTVAGWVLSGVFALLTPFWYATPVIVLWVMSMSGGRSGNRLSTVMVVVAAMWGTIVDSLPQPVLAFAMSVPGTVVFSVLVALYGAWMIRAVLPNGGDRHFSQRQRQVEIIERLHSMGRKPLVRERKLTFSFYDPVLRRAIAARKPGALTMLGLGPAAHWTSRMPLFAIMLVFGIGLRILLVLKSGADDAAFGVTGWVLLLTLVVIVQLGFFGQWRSLVSSARQEFSLLRLAALRPDAREWNRTFGTTLVVNELAFCGLLASTTLLLAWLNGAGHDELIAIGAIAVTLVMPGIAWMLRDYSVDPEPRGLSLRGMLGAVPAALVVLAGLVGIIVLQVAIGSWALVLLAAASNVLGMLFAAWRWKKISIAGLAALPA